LYGIFIFIVRPFVLTHFIYVDDPETFKDAPICIQVIGKTLEEEAVIAMGEIVDSALKTKLAPSKL
jgi:Asp-tRNA(Asn)/Glu-tRNA(Gln) amidotransferase A subunit family amidase